LLVQISKVARSCLMDCLVFQVAAPYHKFHTTGVEPLGCYCGSACRSIHANRLMTTPLDCMCCQGSPRYRRGAQGHIAQARILGSPTARCSMSTQTTARPVVS
jgi:hypothetical protein